jgi:hypothetical protein
VTSHPKKFLTKYYFSINIIVSGEIFQVRDMASFIGRPCKKRADELLKLSRQQLKMAVAILTGHAPVRGHLYPMGLFDGDPTCRFCRKETEAVLHIICDCDPLAHQRYNVFGNPLVEPKDISTVSASVRDLCLYIRCTGLLNLY